MQANQAIRIEVVDASKIATYIYTGLLRAGCQISNDETPSLILKLLNLATTISTDNDNVSWISSGGLW